MKKITVFLFCLMLFISVFPAMAQDNAPETFSSGDWDYIENKTGITLTKYKGNEINLEIPGELDGKIVTQLEKELFMNNMALESVTMPNTIVSTGANVFNGCAALKNVQLSNKLTSINTGVFRYCISLEHIMIPFTVTSINGFAFSDCIQLKDIMLLSVTTIGESAFDNCMSLTDVVVSGKLATVNGRAFRDTPWLDSQSDEFVFMGKDVLIRYNGTNTDVEIPYGTTMISSVFEENYRVESVTIPETVRNIGQYAFRQAINLKHVNIPEYVTTIGANAFVDCTNLTEIDLPEGFTLRSLGGSAFRNTMISTINIPDSVTNLPDNVFGSCAALTDIIIPETVTTIHKNAFANSTNVHLLVTPGSEGERFAQEFEIPYDYTMQAVDNFIISPAEDGFQIIRYTGKLHDIEIPAEINGARVTSIGPAAFQNNNYVSRIILPLTVKSIEDWAFSNMENLDYVQINGEINKLGSNVFNGSGSLREIKLPEKIEEIGSTPFGTDTKTLICTGPESETATALQAMGYNVQTYDACSQDEELLALWADLNGTDIAAEPVCDCSVCGETAPSAETSASPALPASEQVPSDVNIIRIPDGLTDLTPDLLPENSNELILIVPESVTTIDDQILTGRKITIISDSGTAAESFAAANGLKFIMRVNIWLGQ